MWKQHKNCKIIYKKAKTARLSKKAQNYFKILGIKLQNNVKIKQRLKS